jgi:hypothetical protein
MMQSQRRSLRTASTQSSAMPRRCGHVDCGARRLVPPCPQTALARSTNIRCRTSSVVLQTAQRSQYGPGAVAFEFAQVSSGLQCPSLNGIRCSIIMRIAMTLQMNTALPCTSDPCIQACLHTAASCQTRSARIWRRKPSSGAWIATQRSVGICHSLLDKLLVEDASVSGGSAHARSASMNARCQ